MMLAVMCTVNNFLSPGDAQMIDGPHSGGYSATLSGSIRSRGPNTYHDNVAYGALISDMVRGSVYYTAGSPLPSPRDPPSPHGH